LAFEQAMNGSKIDHAFTVSGQHFVLRLHYGHPVVETLINLCRTASTYAHLYANHVRLDKRGLANMAHSTVSLPKGRLIDCPDSFEIRQVFHYVSIQFQNDLYQR
jgi:hypothetical protein